MSTAVTTLVTRVRRRCDLVGSLVVTDDEIADYLSNAAAELYDELIAARGEERFANRATLTVTTSGTATAPTDFMRTLRLGWVCNGIDYPLEPGDIRGQRALATTYQWDAVALPTYSLSQSTTESAPVYRFTPAPTQSQSVSLVYVPVSLQLVRSSPTTGQADVNPYGNDEVLVLGACVQVLAKQELDTASTIAARELLLQRIRTAADDDRGLPRTVIDAGGWGTPLLQTWQRGSW